MVNSERYTTICLPEVFEERRKNNRRRRIILHHDNASCHTSAETIRFLECQKIELTDHPSYSPNLTPKDFYLFPRRINYVVNVAGAVKRPLMRGKCTFWRYLNQNGKSAIKIDSNVCKVHRSSWRIFFKAIKP
ncbi:Mariner Mos1 transposase [Eumeta japonica]|uniref:Mariner Mos1 transposase n=1 Tax=Eumeta variegata TaxID=151549 RepID=A0A4C1TGZ9_EUMVA|nr:Mariner Mos1 transposase [Eumeta japonica]